jgi:hypothetical protein
MVGTDNGSGEIMAAAKIRKATKSRKIGEPKTFTLHWGTGIIEEEGVVGRNRQAPPERRECRR